MSLAGQVQPPLVFSLYDSWIDQLGSARAGGLVAGIEDLHFGSGKMISEISHRAPARTWLPPPRIQSLPSRESACKTGGGASIIGNMRFDIVTIFPGFFDSV